MPPLRQGVVTPSPVRPLIDQAGRLLAAGKGGEALPIASTDGFSVALKQRLQENIPSCRSFPQPPLPVIWKQRISA